MPLVEALSSAFAPLIATIPIIWLLLGLAVFRLKALIVCPVGLLLSIGLACLFWNFSPRLAAESALDGAVFAVWPILWIIIAAFFTYNISLHTGSDKQIKQLLADVSPDPRIQALIIAWGLGSFMEAVAGFGTAVVIPAALLLSLGFRPMLTAVVCLLSNTIAVAFGVVGIPMQTLALVTDLDVFALSSAVIVQLGLLTIAVPFFIVFCVTRSFRGVREVWMPTFLAGLVFAVAQYFVASSIGPELAAVVGAICSILAIVIATRLFPVRSIWALDTKEDDGPERQASQGDSQALAASSERSGSAASPGSSRTGADPDSVYDTLSGTIAAAPSRVQLSEQLKAWSPYIFLFFLVVFSSKLVPPVHALLGQVKSVLPIYSGTGAKPLIIPWLTTPGTLVLAAAILGGLWQGAKVPDLLRIYGRTLKQLASSCVTIVSIVCMAKVLSYSGMMLQLSATLADLAGGAYPALAPFIGALGSFITGSDTSANILFGDLQKQVALQLQLDPVWIAASNTSGACIGKLLSPQNIALAAVATGMAGQEGKLLSVGLLYATPFLLFLGGLVFVLA